MIKSLRDARITDALPRVLFTQDWVKALSGALGLLHEKILDYADGSQIYTGLDNVSEEVLDAVAVNWKIDWYDTSMTLEQKRRVVQSALTVRRLMGTPAAVRMQADAIYPGTELEEWFIYDGDAGYYRLFVNITDTTEESPVIAISAEEMERRLASAKRWSAHLENLSFMVKHSITIGHNIQSWTYNLPECGTLRCGTYHVRKTVGWSEQNGISAGAGVDAYTVSPPLTGTVPETARLGYSAGGTFDSGATVEAYNAAPTPAGIAECGTLPQI